MSGIDEPPLGWRKELNRVLSDGSSEMTLNELSLGDSDVAEVAEKLRGSKTAVWRLALRDNNICDAGAAALAELLQDDSGTSLGELDLCDNRIGCGGIEVLAGALKNNTALRGLWLNGNTGVDPTEEEGLVGIDLLLSMIGVNTTLIELGVADVSTFQDALDAALQDMASRGSGREQFLNGPVTKAARHT
jgi:hypothetical protein